MLERISDVTTLPFQRRKLSGPDMNLSQYVNVLLPVQSASVTVDSLEGLLPSDNVGLQ